MCVVKCLSVLGVCQAQNTAKPGTWKVSAKQSRSQPSPKSQLTGLRGQGRARRQAGLEETEPRVFEDMV